MAPIHHHFEMKGMGGAEGRRAALDHCDSSGALESQHVETAVIGMMGVDQVEVGGLK